MEQNSKANSDTCCGQSLRERIKAKWDKLSDSEINAAEKHMDLLSERIQKTYGRAKDTADREVAEFRRTLGSAPVRPILL